MSEQAAVDSSASTQVSNVTGPTPSEAANPFVYQASQPGEQAPLLHGGLTMFRYQPPEGGNASQDGGHPFLELPPPHVPVSY